VLQIFKTRGFPGKKKKNRVKEKRKKLFFLLFFTLSHFLLVIPPGRLINVRKNDVDVEDLKNEVKHTVAVARYTKSQTIYHVAVYQSCK